MGGGGGLLSTGIGVDGATDGVGITGTEWVAVGILGTASVGFAKASPLHHLTS